MKHINYLEEEAMEITEDGARGVKIRTVIGEKEDAPNFHMRVISVEPAGETPSHAHPWEHQVFVLNGNGTVEVDGKQAELKAGDVVYIPPNARHRFQCTESLEFV